MQRDGLVRFEVREYAVPFAYAGRDVVLIDPECYEGPSTDRVIAPPPLGRMGG